ncbi:MAG: TRAP transporter large permease subunit [Ruminococcaceae bacterium]|nr:TRAP transporter large permease subunit [Oscillospiraceae bacterium]
MSVQSLAILVLLGSFALMILLRFPIAYAVGLSSVFCLLVQGNSLFDVCRLMVKGISSYIISVKRNYPKGEKFHFGNFIKQLGISFWALAAIIIVVVGVVGGAFTATESAAIAVIYSLIVKAWGGYVPVVGG